MNTFGYSQEDITALWELLKAHKAPHWAQPVGIRAVDFVDTFVDEFEARHRKRASELWEGIETVVTKNLGEAIRRLSNGKISHHNLSCVGHLGMWDYTAIYINYVDKETRKHFSLAIPGINYIYPPIPPL